MKKVSFIYDTRNSTAPIYKNSSVEKSQSFNDYVSFLENNSLNTEIAISTDGLLSVDVYFTDEKYTEYLTIYSSISEEIETYNTESNIILTSTVTDVNE